MNDRYKIRFPFLNSSGARETETVWVRARDGGFELDNIPFYVKELALGDIVSAEAAPDGTLWYARLVRASGHSTIRLWFSNELDVQLARDELRKLGCASELSDLPRLVAVDVPPEVPYTQVRVFLLRGEQTGMFDYQEACLGQT